jgi:hypothetical protein
MDESTFHDLLARHWTTLFDQRTIEKGLDYLRRGHVLGTHFAAGDREGAVCGWAAASARDPYAAGVRIEWDGQRAQLDSYCTCPLEFECKHVAATVLYELKGKPDGQPRIDLEAPAPQLGAWKAWLDGLRAPASASAAEPRGPRTGDAKESICAILLRTDGTHPLPALQAQVVRVTPGKRGGYAAPQPLQPSWADPAPWAGLDADTFQLVAGLRMRAPAFGGSGGWFQLASAADEPLLDTLIDALPCFFDKVSAGRVEHGLLRALRIGWEARDDGTQKLALSVDGAAPKTRLLRVGGLGYFDP